MNNCLAKLCAVENDIYGFVIKSYDTYTGFDTVAVNKKKFVLSEMKIYFESYPFDSSSFVEKYVCLFEYEDKNYLVKYSPKFLDMSCVSEVWDVENLSGFDLVGVLDYIFAGFKHGYAGLLEKIVESYGLYLEKKRLNDLISNMVVDKRIVKV